MFLSSTKHAMGSWHGSSQSSSGLPVESKKDVHFLLFGIGLVEVVICLSVRILYLILVRP
jgi:hypothetical protein